MTTQLKLLLILAALISLSAFAETKIEPVAFNDQRCQKVASKYEFETDETLYAGTIYEMDTVDVVENMVSELVSLREIMVAAGDLKLNDDKILCHGIYDDGYLYNAYALGHVAIKIGKGFIRRVKMSYARFADDMITLVLFHEFAHSIQHRHGWQYFDEDKNKRNKLKEMQADCMAGIFMKMQNHYDAETPTVFLLFASLVGDRIDTGDHGTAKERLKALQHGVSMYDANIDKTDQMHSYFLLSNLCHQDSMREIIEVKTAI